MIALCKFVWSQPWSNYHENLSCIISYENKQIRVHHIDHILLNKLQDIRFYICYLVKSAAQQRVMNNTITSPTP